MANKKVRVGIIGLGRISASHIQEFQACPDAQIVAVCDLDPDRIAAAQKEHNLPDVVTAAAWEVPDMV